MATAWMELEHFRTNSDSLDVARALSECRIRRMKIIHVRLSAFSVLRYYYSFIIKYWAIYPHLLIVLYLALTPKVLELQAVTIYLCVTQRKAPPCMRSLRVLIGHVFVVSINHHHHLFSAEQTWSQLHITPISFTFFRNVEHS